MTNSINGMDGAQELLIKLVEQNPEDWATRKKAAQVVFDAGFHREASKMIWSAPEIPHESAEVVFAARIVSKGQPTRAMRLFNTLISNNISQPEENLEIAKLLMKAGMVYQAIRFYGAATALDSRLADETFELSLVSVDSDGESWREFVASEEFAWEGPVTETSQEDDVVDDSYAELLSGATMPVPMKAPARVKTEHAKKTPNSEVGKIKTPSKPKEILKPTSMVKPPELEKKAEVKPVMQEQKKAAVAEVISPQVKPAVTKVVSPSAAAKVDAPAVNIPEAVLKNKVVESVSDNKKDETFFKSYNEAHDHKSEGHTGKMSDGTAPVSTPLSVVPDEKPSPVTEVSPAKKAPESTLPKAAVEAEASESGDESLDDYVAGVLSDLGDDKKEKGQPGKAKGLFGGLFSSLMNKMRGQKNATEVNDHIDEEMPANVTEDIKVTASTNKPQGLAQNSKEAQAPAVKAKAVTQPAQVAAQPKTAVMKSVEKPVEGKLETQVPSNGAVSPNTFVPKPVEESTTPRELDGRTQLVALAPQNGSTYFHQLVDRYNKHPEGSLPKPALLARDMANMDYLGLIGKACSKDLDAFSKLLGLHRVMMNAGCSEWIDDMNLLRKGFGDAVLATVVSKYSVSECRDILNSVYSSPAPQAAAV